MTTARKHNSRCEFLFADGRRCRQQPADPTLTLCLRHLQLREAQQEAARIGDEIAGAEGALNTEEGIHKALASVFSNLARKRITARDASVLGYVGQLMLISRPPVERTFKSMLPMLQLSFKIGERDKDAGIKSSREVLKNALLEQEVINGILAQSEAFSKMTPKDLLAILKFGSMFTDKPFTPPAAKPASPAPPPATAKSDAQPNTQSEAATAPAAAKKSA